MRKRPRAPGLIRTATVLALVAGAALAAAAAAQPAPCAPTRPDDLGPFYTPNAPARGQTGRGLVVSGRVRSAGDCAPLAGARVEWWSANGRGDYDDEHRATQVADAEGGYRYETDVPGRYPGRPPHVHVRVSAPGHRVLVTQVYPRPGQTAIEADFVLTRQ
jgi:protocatechuate 3,4-dioxygenase beta subunit